jgi:hypothetical protein
MEEGMSKAIPLRRSRNGSRAVATRSEGGWVEGLGSGAQLVLAPPRQLWLAGLGASALAWRTIQGTWTRAVTEGAAVEDWMRRALGVAPDEAS